jgi:hypothetical protein
LLNIYFKEFDFFLEHLSFTNNLKWNLLSRLNANLVHNEYKKYFIKYLSVKLHKNLLEFKSLKFFNTVRFSYFEKYFQSFVHRYKLKVYCKHISFLRYLDHFLIGIVGSHDFLNQVKLRITNFARSNLHVSFSTFNSAFYNEPCVFLGFKIVMSFIPVKNKFDSLSHKLKSKHEKRLFFRLTIIKSKLTYIYARRFNAEMLEFFNFLLEDKNIRNFSNTDKQIWTYMFQLEAIRSAQFGALIFSSSGNNFFSENFFSTIRSTNSKILNYKLYSFNVFIKKMQGILQKLVLDSSIFLPTSVLPLDLFFSKLNMEYTKKAIIFLESFSFSKESCTYSLDNSFSFLGSYPLKQEIKSIKLNYSFMKRRSRLITKTSKLFLLVPVEYLVKKLIFLGFLHPFKKRAVGNTKYMLLDDQSIIITFGYFANVLIFWYRCCDDLKKIKAIISIIKQSCFLTLCRKHNKNKNWALRIYTSDLIFIRNSFYSQSFFPLNSYIKSIRKKFLLFNLSYCIFFNETYILS